VAEIKDVENLTDKGLREVIKRALESAVRDPGWLDNHGLANKDLGGATLLVFTNALVPSIRSNMTCITELAIPEAILAKLRDRAKGPVRSASSMQSRHPSLQGACQRKRNCRLLGK
jgi:hypothetical protein